MTRRTIYNRTCGYFNSYVIMCILLSMGLALLYDKCPNTIGPWKECILFLPVFLVNVLIYYRYIYDVWNKNIYEATIVSLTEAGRSGEIDILGRVIKGTICGKNRRNYLLRPIRKVDYIFRKRGCIAGDWRGKSKVKYLKYSKLLLECENLEKQSDLVINYNDKRKDYNIQRKPAVLENNTYFQNKYEEIGHEGNIEYIMISTKEKINRILYGFVYAILVSTLFYVLQKLMIARLH